MVVKDDPLSDSMIREVHHILSAHNDLQREEAKLLIYETTPHVWNRLQTSILEAPFM